MLENEVEKKNDGKNCYLLDDELNRKKELAITKCSPIENDTLSMW